MSDTMSMSGTSESPQWVAATKATFSDSLLASDATQFTKEWPIFATKAHNRQKYQYSGEKIIEYVYFQEKKKVDCFFFFVKSEACRKAAAAGAGGDAPEATTGNYGFYQIYQMGSACSKF